MITMKKLVNNKILFLFIILALGFSQAGAQITTYYVSVNGTGSGGSVSSPMSFAQIQSTLSTLAIGNNSTIQVYFAPGTYNMSSRFTFATASGSQGYKVTFDKTPNLSGDVVFDGGGSAGAGNLQFIRLPRSASSSYPSSLTVKNVAIQHFYNNTVSDQQLFDYHTTYQTLVLENVIIDHCGFGATSLSAAHRMMYVADNHQFYLRNSTIKNCKYHYMIDKRYYDKMEIMGNSFVNNDIYNRLIYMENAPQDGNACLVYNNTFSDNVTRAAGDGVCIYMGGAAGSIRMLVFNNTLYNSGSIYALNVTGTKLAVNNLLAGSSTLTAASTSIANTVFSRNIAPSGGNIYIHTTGNNSNTNITTAFGQQFNTSLSANTEPGKQIHDLLNHTSEDVILGKGGTLSNLSSELGVNITNTLNYDQTGRIRPDNISIGAVDLQKFKIASTRTISSIYNSNGTPSSPESISYDLSQFIEQYPSGVSRSSTGFSVSTTTLSNGSINISGLPIVIFNPRSTATNDTDEFEVTITATDEFGFSHAETFTVKTFVYDIASYTPPTVLPPGYTLSEDYSQTCFDFMGTVEFKSKILFNTEDDQSGSSYYLEGFSVPLVADLDGDGYPEIITHSASANGSGGRTNGIEIFNGQTGKSISRVLFPSPENATYYSSSGSHGSPCLFALVNSNPEEDEIVELIVAFSTASGGSTTGSNKVASYNIVPTKNSSGVTTSYSLVRNWITAQKYNTTTGTTTNGSYEKPIPQIVDLDGDGIPEVVVYNKVYNAHANTLKGGGQLLLTLETLGTNAYVGIQSPTPTSADGYVNFSYVYDMDGDGIYDIIAGGKVYKITKSGDTFSYSIIEMSGVTDGRTGVADIDGDGYPDVVVVNRAGTGDESDIVVKVWNPGFHKSPQQPYIVAQASIKLTTGNSANWGSNSYVYIGDIDGRTQEVGGVEYRLPEIAILTKRVSLSDFPKHPNIASISEGEGGIATSYSASNIQGVLFALTYDVVGQDLKGSFILEHRDRSYNTGFTMFDFDNDGINEICYRDENTLRIIKPTQPFVSNSYTKESNPDIILFSEKVGSFTGFELPVIADINNDASAEMIVMGYNYTGSSAPDYYYSYLYALGTDGDKFAPAWPIWNQFMYDPFKINSDLTIPTKAEGKHAINRLDYSFKHIVNRGTENEKVAEYNPYNGTLIQATKFMMAPDYSYGHIYDPIVFLTEAYLADNNDTIQAKRPELTGTDGNVTITVTIGNRETALTDVALNTPIAIYKNGFVSEDNYVAARVLSDFVYAGTSTKVNSVIKANDPLVPKDRSEEQRISITLTGSNAKADGIYILRLGDNSGYNEGNVWEWKYGLNSGTSGEPDPDKGIGIASRQFRDCDWSDQSVKAAKLNIFPDAATIQAYKDVAIAVFDNDILPDSYFTGFNTIPGALNSFVITTPPVAGDVVVSGTKRDLKVLYKNTRTDNLVNSVDSFVYTAIFRDETNAPVTRTATAYIYILQSETGFATCSSTHTIRLKELPQGNVTFVWNKGNSYLQTGPSRQINFGAGAVDSVYMIEPRINMAFSETYFRNVSFPKGELTVAKGATGVTTTMKWVGTESVDWYNPNNWVEIRNGNEVPTIYTPTTCTNVILPSGASYYPILTSPSVCGKIELGDRAMIAGIHYLAYEDAAVEIKLTPSEKDRFVMMSAPLKKTYTGDYHFYNNSKYYWGDVYMNYFQLKNPDGGLAKENMFTATFGWVADSLELGKAFNLKVTSSTINKEQSFKFPLSYTDYEFTYPNGSIGVVWPPLEREINQTGDVIGRFITYDKDLTVANSPNPVYEIPVANDVNGAALVQVVNPYMAYLDISQFLSANSDKLSNTYAVWNGEVGNSFVQVLSSLNAGNRYNVLTDPSWETTGYIAPLQSFFVAKSSVSNPTLSKLNTVKMSPGWTTTLGGNPYSLRADAPKETNILRIKATQGNKTSYAVLYYDEEAITTFNSKEDMYKLFYDEIPFEVYSFTPTKTEMLAINSSSSFDVQDTDLGLKVNEVGQVTLEFSGIETFGHDVYLIDKELKGKDQEIAISTNNPTYTFTVTKANTELNDRFSLRMNYTGVGLGNESVEVDNFSVSSENGYIYVKSSDMINSLQVYNVNGATIYGGNGQSYQYKVQANRGQVYIVKAMVNGESRVQKIFVK